MGSLMHVAVLAFPFSSHAPKLLALARALATAAPSTTFSFLSTADSLARLHVHLAPENLRFVEFQVAGGWDQEAPEWRKMELFAAAMEAGSLKQALEAARAAAGGVAVSSVVGDAFVSMAADAGVPWVAVWTGGPWALLAHLLADKLSKDKSDHAAGRRGDEPLASDTGLGSFRVRDLPFGGAGAGGDMHRVMSLLLGRVARRLPRAATAVALNAFPGLLPPDISDAIAGAVPCSLPIGPYHLLPGAAAVVAADDDDDPHGCLSWLAGHPAGTVAYVSFGTVATLPPDELRELALGLQATGAPFLWSLRESSWSELPRGFLNSGSGLLVPWAPQATVLRHPAVGAFVTHSGWGAVVEAMSGGVPMACRPFFGDQHMNARAVERLWGFGTSLVDGGEPMARGGVAAAVASLLAGEEGARMRARARGLQAMVADAFQTDGGSTRNFRRFVHMVCGAPARV